MLLWFGWLVLVLSEFCFAGNLLISFIPREESRVVRLLNLASKLGVRALETGQWSQETLFSMKSFVLQMN